MYIRILELVYLFISLALNWDIPWYLKKNVSRDVDLLLFNCIAAAISSDQPNDLGDWGDILIISLHGIFLANCRITWWYLLPLQITCDRLYWVTWQEIISNLTYATGFLSPKLIALPKLKGSVCRTNYSKVIRRNGFMPFLKELA